VVYTARNRLLLCQPVKSRTIIIVLIGLLVLLTVLFGGVETTANKKASLVNPFSDEIPGWAYESIMELAQEGVVTGYEDGQFRPGEPLTYRQLITFVNRNLLALGFTTASELDASAHPDPDSPISRGETAVLLSSVFGETLLSALGETQAQILSRGQIFSDVPVTHPVFLDTAIMQRVGVMTGNADGSFGVDAAINRAATALILDRLNGQIEDLGIRELKDGEADENGIL